MVKIKKNLKRKKEIEKRKQYEERRRKLQTKRERLYENLLILSFFIIVSLLISMVCIYVKKETEIESLHLNNFSKETFATVVDSYGGKSSGNNYIFSVNNKVYRANSSNYRILNNGEKYLIKYSWKDPYYYKVYISIPVILDITKYKKVTAKILHVESRASNNSVEFKYRFNGEFYEREHYVRDAKLFVKGMEYTIFVNIVSPEISYLEGEFIIKKEWQSVKNICNVNH